MTSENRNPPDINEADMRWVLSPFKFVLWARENAEKYGVKSDELVRGFLVRLIRGDDSQCFLESRRLGKGFSAELGRRSKNRIQARVAFEREAAELRKNKSYADLVRRLEKAEELITNSDFSDENKYTEVLKYWTENIKKKAEDGKYNSDVEYYDSRPEELRNAYRDFWDQRSN